MLNLLLVTLLVLGFVLGIRKFVRSCKGQSSCCGSGGDPIDHVRKHLDGPVIATRVFHVDGMSCNHCKARVENAIAKVDGAVAEVDLEAKTATIKLDREVTDKYLTETIEAEGYTVVSVDK